MTYKFTASFVKEGKYYVATAVGLGVTTQGKSLDEARKNLTEAVELFLEDEPALRKHAPKEPPLVTMLEASV